MTTNFGMPGQDSSSNSEVKQRIHLGSPRGCSFRRPTNSTFSISEASALTSTPRCKACSSRLSTQVIRRLALFRLTHILTKILLITRNRSSALSINSKCCFKNNCPSSGLKKTAFQLYLSSERLFKLNLLNSRMSRIR
jgi:hypothetical protein